MGPLKPFKNRLGTGSGEMGTDKVFKQSASGSWKLAFLFGLFFFFLTHCHWRVDETLVNGNKKWFWIIVKSRECPLGGTVLCPFSHTAVSSPPSFCIKAATVELVCTGWHQEARMILNENHQFLTWGHSPKDQLLVPSPLHSLSLCPFSV